uniref:Uncharacterized protein n=1 Tax=Cannabis sativa TaxID=3483 RepID=A0A803P3B8_CANSA
MHSLRQKSTNRKRIKENVPPKNLVTFQHPAIPQSIPKGWGHHHRRRTLQVLDQVSRLTCELSRIFFGPDPSIIPLATQSTSFQNVERY